ncbi:MAG TPA: TldD/PmbA family protein [Sandaracinaceae bacterium LLY-WYZ-13_1]|nr:TldD/PmbA family protein [Sandaracinaceae bacterium LLY-WYZ-13_1]
MATENLEDLLALGERVVESASKAGADVAEAVVSEGSHLSTKVRLGEPELVEEAGSRAVGLRVMIGQQVAVSYTSDLTDAGLARFVEDALELARLSQPDEFAGPPDASLLSERSQHRDLSLYDPSVHEVDAAAALEHARRAEDAARAADERITNSEGATFARASGAKALVTSGGFRGVNDGTYASLSVHPVADDSDGKKRSGFYWSARRFLDGLLSDEEVGREAARRTVAKLGARKVPTQECPVVFDPEVGRSILGLLAGCINGSAVWRRSSYLVDRTDSTIASDLVTVVDDPLIEGAPGSRPFDGEGLLSRRNVVVDRGVLKTYLLDSYAARKLGLESTASAARGGSGGVGPSTSNFVLQPGDTSPEDLLRSTASGLYVTEMMGFGFNAVTGDFSRGASGFWIENGEKTHPVSEVTISLNLDEILKRIDAVADDLDLRTSIATPTFRVSRMTLAGS